MENRGICICCKTEVIAKDGDDFIEAEEIAGGRKPDTLCYGCYKKYYDWQPMPNGNMKIIRVR